MASNITPERLAEIEATMNEWRDGERQAKELHHYAEMADFARLSLLPAMQELLDAYRFVNTCYEQEKRTTARLIANQSTDAQGLFPTNDEGAYLGPDVAVMAKAIQRTMRHMIEVGGRAVDYEELQADPNGGDHQLGEAQIEIGQKDRGWLYPHGEDTKILNLWHVTLDLSSGLDE